MKIGILTVVLILVTLMVSFVTYTNKVSLDSQREECNMLMPNFSNISNSEMSNISKSKLESWGNCINQKQVYGMGYSMKLLAITIFIFLILISSEIDNLKKH